MLLWGTRFDKLSNIKLFVVLTVRLDNSCCLDPVFKVTAEANDSYNEKIVVNCFNPNLFVRLIKGILLPLLLSESVRDSHEGDDIVSSMISVLFSDVFSIL